MSHHQILFQSTKNSWLQQIKVHIVLYPIPSIVPNTLCMLVRMWYPCANMSLLRMWYICDVCYTCDVCFAGYMRNSSIGEVFCFYNPWVNQQWTKDYSAKIHKNKTHTWVHSLIAFSARSSSQTRQHNFSSSFSSPASSMLHVLSDSWRGTTRLPSPIRLATQKL